MRNILAVSSALALTVATLGACGTTSKKESLYPARPDAAGGPPIADPPLQRPTLHVALTHAGLEQLMSALVPAEGKGEYTFVGARQYTWKRAPFTLKFDDARKAILAHADVDSVVDVPGGTMELKMSVDADVQPVLSADHKLVLQAVKVEVTSDDKRVQLAQWGAGVVDAIEKALQSELEKMRVDFAPTLAALHQKLESPMWLPLGAANACFNLDVRGIEAGPSIFAGGFEKQLALVVAPSITMPCTVRGTTLTQADPLPPARPLPALHNASAIEGGPFKLEVPIAAGYDEIEKAMSLAFTEGRLFFSESQPKLYLTEPRVYAADGSLVVSVKIAGIAEAADMQIIVDGEIFLSGHPRVRDNFLEVPDIKPTIETDQALLKLAAAVKEQELTAAVRKALRLDLSDRLGSMKQRLVDSLSVEVPLATNVPPLCTRAEVGRIEVTSAEAHDAYLRVYVNTTATASAYLPCPAAAAAPAAPVVGAR